MRNRVKVHREGIGILIASFFVLLAISVIICLLFPVVGVCISVMSVVIYGLMINFFRSPKRYFAGDTENVIVSSVDGKVVALEETYEGEYLHQKVVQVSVFMTIFDVHANWYPVNGKVIYTGHSAGRFLSAWLPKSSTENERSTIVIRTESGHDVLVRQVAGAIARRIVTYAEPGIQVSIGEQMGFIKFGSRVDIYLPLDTEIFVQIGDKTIGGITEIGRLQH